MSPMLETEFGARELSRQECLALLPAEPYGRLVFVQGSFPTVLPVNFVLDGAQVVIRTREGSNVSAAAGVEGVAFQVDSIDRARRSGWSVTVGGRARIAADPLEVERLQRLPLHPWVGGERSTFLLIEVGMVSGRRIGGPEPVHADRVQASSAEAAVPRPVLSTGT